MVRRNVVLLAQLLICSGCAENQTLPTSYEAETLPDSKVVSIKTNELHGFVLHEKIFTLTYMDGVESEWGFGPRGSLRHEKKILPGIHRLGILVNWGFIPPVIGGMPFNFCYSGVVLKAEAGRKYGFDIVENEDKVNLLVLDDAGAVVEEAFCEKLPSFSFPHVQSSKDPTIKSIQERIEKETKELEIQEIAE